MQGSANLDRPRLDAGDAPAPVRPVRPGGREPERRRVRRGHRGRELALREDAARSERRRLAREIHDQLGSTLALTLRFLELAELTGESDPAAARCHTQRAREGVDQAIRDARSLITDLGGGPDSGPGSGPAACSSPSSPSLRREIQDFLRSAGADGPDVHIRVTGDERGTDHGLRQEAFLIIREALLNVLAHARASRAWVDVRFTGADLRASVRDDGAGFPPPADRPVRPAVPDEAPTREAPADEAPARERPARYGLTAMRERAESVGGTVRISSSPSHGTQVDLVLPVPAGRRARR